MYCVCLSIPKSQTGSFVAADHGRVWTLREIVLACRTITGRLIGQKERRQSCLHSISTSYDVGKKF